MATRSRGMPGEMARPVVVVVCVGGTTGGSGDAIRVDSGDGTSDREGWWWRWAGAHERE